jgi:mono/diheme cytochrome c family protein
MRLFISGMLAALMIEAGLAAITWAFVLPRLDWSAQQKPGVIEEKLANNIVARWVKRNGDSTTSPFASTPTPANLMMALKEYEEHCAACHGADGSGRDRFEADFYPAVPNLIGTTTKLSDAQLYFIITNGIRNTAMPGFGKNHSADDIWRTILWMRHLAKLPTEERVAIGREMQREREQHISSPKRGVGASKQTE